MTYNFDPERWYDNEYTALEERYRRGRLTIEQFEAAVSALEEQQAEMWKRLDGSYRIDE